MKIAEVKALDDKDIVSEVAGTLVGIYERKTGEGSNGAWSLQNCELEDDSGRMKLILSNRPEMPRENRGKNVVIKCHKGDKGKSGIYAKDDTYNGVTTRKIRVTSTGRFLFDGEGSGSPAEPAPAATPVQHNGNGSATNKAVFGGTAGCMIKLAVDVVLSQVTIKEYFYEDGFLDDVYKIASGLVRVSQKIESGDLYVPKDNVVEAAKELFQAEDENQEEEWK